MFVEKVQERTGFDSETEASELAQVTLENLAVMLPRTDRQRIAEKLPGPLDACVREAGAQETMGLEEFYDRVSAREAVNRNFGMEHAQAVLEVLGERLDEEERTIVERRLPDEFGSLLTPREFGHPDDPHRRKTDIGPDDRRNLATGEAPRASEPLSEARSSGEHEDSVARNPNPRGDHKLSTGEPGPHEGDDLATGRPTEDEHDTSVPPEEEEEDDES